MPVCKVKCVYTTLQNWNLCEPLVELCIEWIFQFTVPITQENNCWTEIKICFWWIEKLKQFILGQTKIFYLTYEHWNKFEDFRTKILSFLIGKSKQFIFKILKGNISSLQNAFQMWVPPPGPQNKHFDKTDMNLRNVLMTPSNILA